MLKLFKHMLLCISEHGMAWPLAVFLVCLSSTAGSLHADSMFAAPHLGIPVAPGDARSRALGGISAAIPGEDFTISNPARTVNFWRAGFNGVIAQDYRSLKGPGGNLNLRSTEFLSFRGIFPSYKKFVLSWGVCQRRDLTWEYSDRLNLDFFPGEISRTLYVELKSKFLSGYSYEETYRFKYPLSWRLGFSKRITQHSLIGADIEYEGWKGSDLDLEQPATAANQWRYCIGYEFLPAAVENPPLYRKFPLRLGFSQATYPYKISGSSITETSFSFGTGRYFANRNGLVDIAFEYLKRRTELENYPEERVFRVVFSLSAFERWVTPPRRR